MRVEVTVSSANLDYAGDSKVLDVRFANGSLWTEWKLNKVDDEDTPAPVKDAKFVVADENGKYYAGQTKFGYGNFVSDIAKATRFTTDENGLLDVKFVMSLDTAKENLQQTESPIERVQADYTLVEVYAPEQYLVLAEDRTATLTASAVLDQTGSGNEPLVDGTGLHLNVKLVGHTK